MRYLFSIFVLMGTAPTEIYTYCHTLSLHDALPISLDVTIQAQILNLLRDIQARLGTAIMLITHDLGVVAQMCQRVIVMYAGRKVEERSEEHTSELQSLMRISYAVFCLTKKINTTT